MWIARNRTSSFVGWRHGLVTMAARSGTPDDRARSPARLEITHQMNGYLALLGILLIVLAIPFGLMLAPLVIGVLLVWYGLRRLDGAVERPVGEPA
jgi:hypothetical protein